MAVSCAPPGIFDRGWRGGGGGGRGPYPTFSKSSTYLTVVHQWFISGPTFSRGGGGGGGARNNQLFIKTKIPTHKEVSYFVSLRYCIYNAHSVIMRTIILSAFYYL